MPSSTRRPGFRPAVPDDLEFDPVGAERSFPDAFRAVAAEHGARVAVVGASGCSTYAALDGRSDAVASAVAEAGSAAPIVVMAGHEEGVRSRRCSGSRKRGTCTRWSTDPRPTRIAGRWSVGSAPESSSPTVRTSMACVGSTRRSL